MRQGPDYGMWIKHPPEDQPYCPVPLELFEEFAHLDHVVWTDNGDGSYTLRPEPK